MYEFDHIDDLFDQVKKIVRLKEDDYGKKLKNKVRDIEPEEETYSEGSKKVLEEQFSK